MIFIRHFSRVTKSRIFKNLNLRKKSRWQLSRHFPEKSFQAPKIIFKSPKLIGQVSLVVCFGSLWYIFLPIKKKLTSHFFPFLIIKNHHRNKLFFKSLGCSLGHFHKKTFSQI